MSYIVIRKVGRTNHTARAVCRSLLHNCEQFHLERTNIAPSFEKANIPCKCGVVGNVEDP